MTEINEFFGLLASILAWGMLCAVMFWVIAVFVGCGIREIVLPFLRSPSRD